MINIERPKAKPDMESAKREASMFKMKIANSICPLCDSKLTRGKRDRDNDYKRLWHCDSCDIEWTNHVDKI